MPHPGLELTTPQSVDLPTELTGLALVDYWMWLKTYTYIHFEDFCGDSETGLTTQDVAGLTSYTLNSAWLMPAYAIPYEPRHMKTNIVHLQPAWIQMSLRNRTVSSGSLLFA